MRSGSISLLLVGMVALTPLPGLAVPGLLVAEQAQITSRICVYDAVGERFTLTVGLANVCPPSYDPDTGNNQNDRDALNAQIARGFGSQVQGLGTAFQDGRNKQRQADLDAELRQLQIEKMRRDQAGTNQVPTQDPIVFCIRPPGNEQEYVTPFLVEIRRSGNGLAVKSGGVWEDRPYTYDGGKIVISAPLIRRGSGPDAPIEASTFVIEDYSATLIPDADLQTTFAYTCAAAMQ